ncbi:uncharacterized protein B0H18DRAFT_1030877 [Fomitopsis serialis]|uniref:uncharacterized protein n=1 Tax=Fomitopsis serialis TaxID=139415 RepID=UPI002008B6F4|nr:uncharacterized protein B0H18DRAFT_1030877 [Neoantrodia serialis]KAH9918478.1 hypothetical protein B0H18DRAFT_1030877 [Neoantrodia serialis]
MASETSANGCSIHVYYRLDGSRVAYLRSAADKTRNYYDRFLRHDLRYLGFRDAQKTLLQRGVEGKIECRWHPQDDEDDVEVIREQVHFLQQSDAARMMELLEICMCSSRIEMVPSPPSVNPPETQAFAPNQQSATLAASTQVDPTPSPYIKREQQDGQTIETRHSTSQATVDAPTERDLLELRDLLERHQACEALHKTQNTKLQAEYRCLQGEERRATEEHRRLRRMSESHSNRGARRVGKTARR